MKTIPKYILSLFVPYVTIIVISLTYVVFIKSHYGDSIFIPKNTPSEPIYPSRNHPTQKDLSNLEWALPLLESKFLTKPLASHLIVQTFNIPPSNPKSLDIKDLEPYKYTISTLAEASGIQFFHTDPQSDFITGTEFIKWIEGTLESQNIKFTNQNIQNLLNTINLNNYIQESTTVDILKFYIQNSDYTTPKCEKTTCNNSKITTSIENSIPDLLLVRKILIPNQRTPIDDTAWPVDNIKIDKPFGPGMENGKYVFRNHISFLTSKETQIKSLSGGTIFYKDPDESSIIIKHKSNTPIELGKHSYNYYFSIYSNLSKISRKDTGETVKKSDIIGLASVEKSDYFEFSLTLDPSCKYDGFTCENLKFNNTQFLFFNPFLLLNSNSLNSDLNNYDISIYKTVPNLSFTITSEKTELDINEIVVKGQRNSIYLNIAEKTGFNSNGQPLNGVSISANEFRYSGTNYPEYKITLDVPTIQKPEHIFVRDLWGNTFLVEILE